LGDAITGCKQPSSGKARDQGANNECDFQYSECNSDYRIVSEGPAGGMVRIR
jgi:hypothetical protein